MNLNSRCLAVACAAASFVSATVTATDTIVGGDERRNVHVESGSVLEQEGAVWVQPGGVLDKTGKGDWTLPLGLIVTPSDTTINVRDGSVTIPAVEGDAPTVETPTATLNKAALWIDPSVKCDLDADGKSVLRLPDVRETATSVPYNYLRAVSMTNFVQKFPQIEGAGQGLKCVNFGAYKSGKWMRLTNAGDNDGSACSKSLRSKIRHIFIVYQVVSSQGFVFSVEDGNYISFHSYDSAGAVNRKLISRDASTAPSQMSARCYINGKRCDPTATIPPQRAFMVLEFHFCGTAGSMDGFFNDRNMANRQGGDYLAETLVFTNTLSEVERIQVGRYLSSRWQIPFVSGSKVVKVAKGASVNLPAGLKDVPVTGEGEICVVDGGASSLGHVNPNFYGEVQLPKDEQIAVRDDLYSYSLEAGDKLTVKTGLSEKCYSGDTVVRSSGQSSNSIVKDGNGTASIRSVPKGVKKIAVQEGTLSISAPYRSTLASGSETAASIPNPGFEKAATLTTSAFTYLYNTWSNGANLERTVVDWTGRMLPNPDGSYSDEWSAFFSASHQNYEKFSYGGYPLAPEGLWAFAFRGKGEIETDVDIPVDGTYEFSFKISSHYYADAADQMIIEVFIGSDASNLTRYVRTVPFLNLGYSRYSCMIPGVKKGKKLLRIRTTAVDYYQSSASVDDIRMDFVSEQAQGFLVPNGDFENYTSSDMSDISPRIKSTKDTPVGWALTQVDWCGDTTMPSIAIARFGASIKWASNAQPQLVSNAADWEHGNVQLLFASAKGAKAETSFRPPKTGLYFVKAKLGEFCHSQIYNDTCKFSGRPAIEIAVRQGDGTFSSCGVVTPEGRMMKGVCWPKPIRITDTDTLITVAVSNTVAASAALLDDLEFVPCREVLSSNLLVDGGFESNSYWETVDRKGTDDWNDKSKAAHIGFSQEHYGYDKGEGARAITLIDFAGCYQPVRFPVPGRYRLRFITRARVEKTSPTYYSPGAKMRAVLAKGSVTNELVSLETPTTNFVGHTVFFDVDNVDADYVFGFEAANDKRVSGFKDRMVFIDDASIVYCGDSFADGRREVFQIPEGMSISVDDGAKLDADFAGMHTLAEMRLGGRRVSGVISKNTHPEYISGIGMFYVQPKGTCIHFR